MKRYIKSDTEIQLNQDEQYKILKKFKWWMDTTFEPYRFSFNVQRDTPALMMSHDGTRYVFGELYSDSWIYGVLSGLPKVIIRTYVYLDDKDYITGAEVYCNFKDDVSRDINNVELIKISDPNTVEDKNIEVRYPDIFSSSPYCEVDGLSIPNFKYDRIPLDVSYLVESLDKFYNGIGAELLESDNPKPTKDNQSAIRSLVRKNNYDRKQTYEMNYRVYSDRGHTGLLETDKIYKFTAPGDYWALFGTVVFNNITPKNLSENFKPQKLKEVVDKHPTYKSLLNSNLLNEWSAPDEYTIIAYMKNLDTGKILFEYDVD